MKEWSIKKSLFLLIASTLATLLFTLTGYFFYRHHTDKRLQNPNCQILSIIQTGPEKEALSTAYLAELLSLSLDQPAQLYAFDLKKAHQRLLSSPLIESASLKRVPPSALYIDYTVRRPIALLADYKNTAIDATGHLFPFHPFFAPRNLPELYLGLPPFTDWHIDTPSFTLALELLHFFEEAPWKEGIRLKRIDVSNAYLPSLGQREIVLFTDEELLHHSALYTFPKILRLAPKDFSSQLTNFLSLRRTILQDYQQQLPLTGGGTFAPRIVDLRLPQLAFIEK